MTTAIMATPIVTTPITRLKKISSRRVRAEEWSKIEWLPVSKKPPVAERVPASGPGRGFRAPNPQA